MYNRFVARSHHSFRMGIANVCMNIWMLRYTDRVSHITSLINLYKAKGDSQRFVSMCIFIYIYKILKHTRFARSLLCFANTQLRLFERCIYTQSWWRTRSFEIVDSNHIHEWSVDRLYNIRLQGLQHDIWLFFFQQNTSCECFFLI